MALATGCTDLTGRGPAPLDKTLNGNIETHPRMGHVYCMRGWLGIFSTGMDALAVKIDTDLGVAAVSVANEEHYRLRDFILAEKKAGKVNEPLVLLGHSYGADDQIRVAQTLKENGIKVDLMVLIDPVTPPKVPSNVTRVYCIYKSRPLTDMYPWWRGVPVEVANAKKTELVNVDLRTAEVGFDTDVHHALIDKVPGIHKMCMDEIAKVCPPRPGIAQKPWVPGLEGIPALVTTPAPRGKTPASPNGMPRPEPKPAPGAVEPVAAPGTPRTGGAGTPN